ncbi:MAG: cupin domain-containing protein [Saccharopolyspora sp.]|uniref:cupin domain-containing protein n=1 Tax=Saccharopolyspora sp. TaxID=33915 RepID=UPI0025E1ACDC|nr:cupin domain-containing protein [Saccharopolyspora sp.]MBQ6642029.1 cupin domain-containing protein [Saccharopolyspora sp.]
MVVRSKEVYDNPVCGERVVIRRGNDEGDGSVLIWDLYLEPGGTVVGEHYHPTADERFVLVSGKLGIRAGGRSRVLEEVGESVLAEAGTRHYFWNGDSGPTRIVIRMQGRVDRFEQAVFRQLYGLAQDGRTDSNGKPGLLQHAVTSAEYADIVRFAAPPWPVQRLLFGVLAPVGRALGYRALCAEYRDRRSPLVAELDPLPPEFPEL